MQNALRSYSKPVRAEKNEAGLSHFRNTFKEDQSMKTVYLLESVSHPGKRYVGITTNLEQRLAEHNAGKSPHTSRFRPWNCAVSITFSDDCKAEAFEDYLKQGTVGLNFTVSGSLSQFVISSFHSFLVSSNIKSVINDDFLTHPAIFLDPPNRAFSLSRSNKKHLPSRTCSLRSSPSVILD